MKKKDKEKNINNELNNENIENNKDTDKQENFKPKISWFDRIPYFLKALFIKYWFFCALYFFFVMGIPNLNFYAYMIIMGVAVGLLNDLVIYKLLDLLDDYSHQLRYYVFFRSKKFYSVFINSAYGLVLGSLSYLLASVLRVAIETYITGGEVTSWFAEPFSFGLLAFVIDAIFIGFKNLCVYLYGKIFRKESL